VDSNPRAVECTRKGAKLNRLANVTVSLDAGSSQDEPGTYDLALANPPYYSSYQIAEVFLQRALSALKPGGRMLVVARQIDWYAERMPQLFEEFSVEEIKTYFVATGRGVKPRRR
jgi:16S rRNA (guanine1207-N2)-methyltransferase